MININIIIRIERCKVSEMAGLRRSSARSVVLQSACPWTPVCIKVPADLTVSEKVEAGQRIWTARLNFLTPEEFERERMVYKATAADGKEYIIGTNERPYPVTTMTEPHPDKVTDNQLFKVSVSYSSACQIPYIAGS